MANPSDELIRRSGYAREGFAAQYDRYRASPPEILLEVLCRLARVERPSLVVDLGSGTGLSTRAWAGRARRVLGVEPNPAMLARARARTVEWDVEYVEAYSNATGLEAGSADVVTCSQSFHWMEPEPTLAEVARILRPHGVFAAYDYEFPFVIEPELDEAIDIYLRRRREVRERTGSAPSPWSKSEHLERIEASGLFRATREILLHGEAEGGVDRIMGAVRSIGPSFDELEPDLDELRRLAERVVGDRVLPWLIPYRVRVGIR